MLLTQLTVGLLALLVGTETPLTQPAIVTLFLTLVVAQGTMLLRTQIP